MPLLHPQDFRGTNYTPSITRGFVTNLGLLPWVPGTQGQPTRAGGFFDRNHCEQEIAALGGAGLNNIRMLGSFYAWVYNRQQYMASLLALAMACVRHHVRITYVFWNTTLWGDGEYNLYGALMYEIMVRQYRGGPNATLLGSTFDNALRWSTANSPPYEENLTQYTEPGPDPMLWDPSAYGPGFDRWHWVFRSLVDKYVTDICELFREPAAAAALASFDLYNEPDTTWESRVGQFPLRIPFVERFIHRTYKLVKTVIPDALCTIGWAGLVSSTAGNHNARIEALGVMQDYYSFHAYPAPADMAFVVREVPRILPRYRHGVPVVCSEFWSSLFRGSLGEYFSALRGAGFGGQMWGFLQHNAYDPGNGLRDFDGVLIPTPAQRVNQMVVIGFDVADEGDQRAVVDWSRS